jgi:glutamine amidotransferase
VIGIVDYEIGNLRSVQKALQRAGGEARLVRTPRELAESDKIVLPGVAAFGDAVIELQALGLVEPLRKAIAAGTPYLGFCLGLQLLFDRGYEDGMHEGLGVLRGEVVRFNFPQAAAGAQRLSVPHMGWNQLRLAGRCPMLAGIEEGAHVYFAHSYHVVPADASVIAAWTDYGGEFVSAVWKDNVFATQFHPEKSQAVGLRLLENFVRL